MNTFAPHRDGVMMMYGQAGHSEETCVIRLKRWCAHAFFLWNAGDDVGLQSHYGKLARTFTTQPDSWIVEDMRGSGLWSDQALECLE